MKLIVFGGNGFLGSQICKRAVASGWEVTSLSRSGSKKFQGTIPLWATKVRWEEGDASEPSSYRHLLSKTDAVVHSIGSLMDLDYKKLAQSTSIFGLGCGIINSATSLIKNRIPQPINNMVKEKINNPKSDLYRINFLTAKSIHNELANHPNVKSMAYISATQFLPSFLADPHYLASKRAAEQYLLTSRSESNLNLSILRPGLMYSESRPLTIALAGGLSLGPSQLVTKPLAVTTVADSVLSTLQNYQQSGSKAILEIDDIYNATQ